MKVFGRAGLFNVVQRTQAAGQSTMHIIEGDMEVKRNGEQGVDLFKFQIESFGQKQIDYRSQKFVHGAGVMFTGDLHAGVIKIKDVDLISNNHFFNDNTKALMSATNKQTQNNTYQGYGATQQQNQHYQQQYNSAPPVAQAQNPYVGYGAQNVNQQPVQNQYATPVQPAQNQYVAPVQNQYAAPAQNQYAPPAQNEATVQNQYPANQENLQQQNQYAQQNAQPTNNVPAFASPNNQQQQTQQTQQQTQPINYADLFNTNK